MRGFHYYSKIWSPKEGEILNCYHERDNAFDIFVIKTESKKGSNFGHLLREVSRVTKFILDRGAKVTATLTSTNFRCSPLAQGGLEIACQVTAKMPATIKNHMILDRLKELVNDHYAEPTDKEILGYFLAIILHDSPVKTQKSSPFKEKKILSNLEIKVPDIREMFRRQAENGQRNEQKDNSRVIVID